MGRKKGRKEKKGVKNGEVRGSVHLRGEQKSGGGVTGYPHPVSTSAFGN